MKKIADEEDEKQKLAVLWEWLARPLPTKPANKEEATVRWKEIPPELKLTAEVALILAIKRKEMGDTLCSTYRMALFHLIKELEEKGIELMFPYYWYTDGVMIEPEWIVRLTNGLVQWEGDVTCEHCGLASPDWTCPYAKVVKEGKIQ